jgi:serine phosphatase RsbU (regulator of sigma subunit)
MPKILLIDDESIILENIRFVLELDLNSTGTVLGIFEEEEYLCNTLQLLSGDKLLLFTDGVVEAAYNNLMFGFDGLVNALNLCKQSPIEEIVAYSFSSVAHFSHDEFDDDLTILGVETI